MNLFRNGRTDGALEGAAQRIPQSRPQGLAATTKRRVEVNIRQMKKPEHGIGCFYKRMRFADSACSISSASQGWHVKTNTCRRAAASEKIS